MPHKRVRTTSYRSACYTDEKRYYTPHYKPDHFDRYCQRRVAFGSTCPIELAPFVGQLAHPITHHLGVRFNVHILRIVLRGMASRDAREKRYTLSFEAARTITDDMHCKSSRYWKEFILEEYKKPKEDQIYQPCLSHFHKVARQLKSIRTAFNRHVENSISNKILEKRYKILSTTGIKYHDLTLMCSV